MRIRKTTPSSSSGKIIGLLLLTALICIPSVPARAVGIGPYIDLAGGTGEFEWSSDYGDFDVDVGTAAVGLAIDSAPTYESNFNYRLNIGFEAQNLEDDYDVTLELKGVALENIFGFAVVRRPNLRWWVGPLIRIGYYTGDTDEYNFYDYYSGNIHTGKTEVDLFEFGIGVATGINIKVNRNLVLAPSAGVRYIGASGDGTVTDYTDHTRYDDDLNGHFSTAFINFALLFQ